MLVHDYIVIGVIATNIVISKRSLDSIFVSIGCGNGDARGAMALPKFYDFPKEFNIL